MAAEPTIRPRARALGVILGVLPPGPRNAITDVAGVRVGHATLRRWAFGVAGVALWQLASGLSNVVLGWPIVAAMAHTGGAAALVTLLAALLTQARRTSEASVSVPAPDHPWRPAT